MAATALLVTNSDMPEVVLTTVLEALFTATATAGAGASAARLAPGNARIGVTIPLHEGAARYFESQLPVLR